MNGARCAFGGLESGGSVWILKEDFRLFHLLQPTIIMTEEFFILNEAEKVFLQPRCVYRWNFNFVLFVKRETSKARKSERDLMNQGKGENQSNYSESFCNLGTKWLVHADVEQTVLTPFSASVRTKCIDRVEARSRQSLPKYIESVSTLMIYRPVRESPSLHRIFINYNLVSHLAAASLSLFWIIVRNKDNSSPPLRSATKLPEIEPDIIQFA